MRAIPFLFATTLTACQPVEEACTDHLAWSVALTLVDEAGEPVEGAAVSVTDGDVTEDCYADENTYSCGAELEGDLTLSIQADGYTPEDLDITVASDECHVITESVTHTLMTADCLQDVVPSVVVSIFDEEGDLISSAEASYSVVSDDKDGINGCEAVPDVFHCGENIAGDIEVFAMADGYATQSALVTVSMSADGCYVLTETLDFFLIED